MLKINFVLYWISVIILVCYLIFLGINFSKIQDTIPIHYSGKNPDGFGSKYFLWLEVGLNSIVLLFIGLIIYHPHWLIKKYEQILESTYESAIKNRQIFLSVLALLVTIILCGISFFSLQ